MTRSPSPLAWRPDFPRTPGEAHWPRLRTSWETARGTAREPLTEPRMVTYHLGLYRDRSARPDLDWSILVPQVSACCEINSNAESRGHIVTWSLPWAPESSPVIRGLSLQHLCQHNAQFMQVHVGGILLHFVLDSWQPAWGLAFVVEVSSVLMDDVRARRGARCWLWAREVGAAGVTIL